MRKLLFVIGWVITLLSGNSDLAWGKGGCPLAVADKLEANGLPLLERPAESTRAWTIIPEEELSEYGAFYAGSDFHGQLLKLIVVLNENKVIDNALNWSAGNAIFVVSGDFINKGPDSVGMILFLMKLQRQAAEAGGRVIVTLGNHETRLLAAANFEETDFAKDAAWQRLPMLHRNEILIWLRELPLGAFVGNTFICHSGYLTKKNFRKGTAALAVNDYTAKRIAGPKSMVEARGWYGNSDRLAKVVRAANTLGVTGILFGHDSRAFGTVGIVKSPTGFFVDIDPNWTANNGMLYYATSALEVSREGLQVGYRLTSKGNVKPLLEKLH